MIASRGMASSCAGDVSMQEPYIPGMRIIPVERLSVVLWSMYKMESVPMDSQYVRDVPFLHIIIIIAVCHAMVSQEECSANNTKKHSKHANDDITYHCNSKMFGSSYKLICF
ncbi:hypothetical protein M514_18760, partial [Trichuris suis]